MHVKIKMLKKVFIFQPKLPSVRLGARKNQDVEKSIYFQPKLPSVRLGARKNQDVEKSIYFQLYHLIFRDCFQIK